MKLIVDALKTKESLGDMYGIFFEDLNHAADGGLYAELVQNRSFEFAPIDHPTYHPLMAWEKIDKDGEARLLIETGNPVSNNNPHYLAIDISNPGSNVGVQNLGFNTGIPFKEGEEYYFTCYIKREQDLEMPITVSFRSKDGEIYLKEDFYVETSWKKFELKLKSPVTDYSGRLALTIGGRGKVYIDFVSLFPVDTFKGRRNGLRKDIAEKLAELKPKFMRFPGGCLVHDGSLDPDARDAMYRWKNTIGPVEERPARRSNWGYNQTLGLGYFEYFQFCEDIGAKPLPVLPAGWDPHHKRAVPLDELDSWIQEAIDLIEFATGDSSTTWGRKRAELGHEEPFGLEYLGIGNEEVGAEFFERYVYFHNAIREKYPDIKIINSSGPFAAGGEYERGWESAKENKSDLVDEHYYASPEWFLANHHRYDEFKANDPKVFLGEYASWGNTYYNALAEASYMIGLERNAKAVGLACYAPLLCNVDYVNWKPDMIWFDNRRVYGTPNYYVQKLFMHHQGDTLIDIKGENVPEPILLSADIDKISGDLVLSSNDTVVEYYDISVINQDTKEVKTFDSCKVNREDKDYFITNINWNNYSIKLKAKELDGFKGFKIQFGKKDDNNKLFLELGGWQNQDAVVCEDINGRNSCLSQYLITIEKEKEYEIELKVTGRLIRTFVNGEAYHTIESKPVVIEPLYYIASKDESTGEIIVKVVNVSNQLQTANIELLNVSYSKGKIFSLCNYDLDAVNDFDQPEFISPKEKEFVFEDSNFNYEFEKESITIFRFQA
jgi:alpha-L-arabinofuranosidase